jgi:hypothetical protein
MRSCSQRSLVKIEYVNDPEEQAYEQTKLKLLDFDSRPDQEYFPPSCNPQHIGAVSSSVAKAFGASRDPNNFSGDSKGFSSGSHGRQPISKNGRLVSLKNNMSIGQSGTSSGVQGNSSGS